MSWLTDPISRFFVLLEYGGWLMVPIIGCSLVAVAVFLERRRTFARSAVDVDQLTTRMLRLVGEDRSAEALEICRETPGPAARVLEAGILHRSEPLPEIRTSMGDAAKTEVDRLERYLPLLATIAQIAPLLGLLGTVAGMMEVFQRIEALEGHIQISHIAGGIWKALLTTAGGLVVATICLMAHHYLTRKAEIFVQEAENAASLFLDLVRSRSREMEDR